MNPVVIIGQGPNQTAWKRGSLVGRQYESIRMKMAVDDDRLDCLAVLWAEKYCARVAITGALGQKLAELAAQPFQDFLRSVDQRNLNARWNGKCGKGDKFDTAEGKQRAAELLAGSWLKYVLLGREVAACFGMGRTGFLEVVEDWIPGPAGERDVKKQFLIFPHPSGVSTWWNKSFNKFRAAKRFREFLQA